MVLGTFVPRRGRSYRALCAVVGQLHSSITDFELWNCAVSPECFSEFLRGFTVLQTFKYSFADPAKAPLAKALNFNPFMIRSSLISHSATTLRKIVMLAHPNDLAPLFMGSLREFSALTELRTNHSCLVGEDFYRPTLSQILPYSLRRLVLDGQKRSMLNEVTVDPIDFAVRAAVDAKSGRGLPRIEPIEELVFAGYEEFVKDYLMTSAEEVSLVVKFLTGDELDQTSLASSH